MVKVLKGLTEENEEQEAFTQLLSEHGITVRSY